MRLNHLLLKRLFVWLGLWLLLCMAVLKATGQNDVTSEYQNSLKLVQQVQDSLLQNPAQTPESLNAMASSLARAKSGAEHLEARDDFVLTIGMLLLMGLGSGVVVWLSLKPMLDKPLKATLQWLKSYERENNHAKPPPPPVLSELNQLQAGIERLIATLQTEQQHSKSLYQRVVKVQEQERQTIAQDLHDHLGQMLTSIAVNAAFLTKTTEGNARDAALAIQQQSQDMMSWLRSSLRELKPLLVMDVSLRDATIDLVETWAKRKGWFVDFAWQDNTPSLAKDTAATLFRVLQEALTNAARHSQAKHVKILAGAESTGKTLILIVENDGVADDQRPVLPSLGLCGITERLNGLGGQAHWRRQDGRFALECHCPLIPENLANATVQDPAG